jgi:dihydrofolate reductase
VISRQADCQCDGADVVHNLFDAIEKAREMHTKEMFVIGGGQIYKESLVVANRIYITRVHATFPDADTFFDGVNWHEWHKVKGQHFEADEKNNLAHSIEVWERNEA